jgi:tRNA (mo5U34)-methyltransferase
MSTQTQGFSNEKDISPLAAEPDRAVLEREISQLGDWFHNIDIHGVLTAPNHFLGDFPNVKWKHIEPAIPPDLAGASVLDIGCNGGFYSIQMKRRGAGRVLGIDVDERYLDQGRYAARALGLTIEFELRSVYEVAEIAGQFDFVIFMGVLYHLRYPLFALDNVIKKIAPRGTLLFQTMLRGSQETCAWEENYHFWNKEIFEVPEFPRMYFIENSYANDQTNWWIPNRACAEGMLRSSGLEIMAHPESETWLCSPSGTQRDGKYILDLELSGSL